MKPMLSCNKIPDIDTEVPYPCLASAKLDGIRAMVYQGKLVSRTLKPIPNLHVRKALEQPEFEGLDGELTLRNNPHDFNANQSAFMTIGGTPDFVFNVFDDRTEAHRDAQRRKAIAELRVFDLTSRLEVPIEFCSQYLIQTPGKLRDLYASVRELGYEGLIVMHPDKTYKTGRSTLKQQISLKLKPCEDAEAIVVGYEELMRNLDAGNSKRQENLVPGGMLGTLLAVRVSDGLEIRVGGGFKEHERIDIWNNPVKYMGKTFTYKFMEVFHDTGAPRGAVFKGWRKD